MAVCCKLTITNVRFSQGPAATAVNAELFSHSPDNLQMLLTLLEDGPSGVPDFYVRYHTVQIMTALAAVSSYRMQEVSPDMIKQ